MTVYQWLYTTTTTTTSPSSCWAGGGGVGGRFSRLPPLLAFFTTLKESVISPRFVVMMPLLQHTHSLKTVFTPIPVLFLILPTSPHAPSFLLTHWSDSKLICIINKVKHQAAPEVLREDMSVFFRAFHQLSYFSSGLSPTCPDKTLARLSQ